MSDLGERLQAGLRAYYDWVAADSDENGRIKVRVGQQNPTEEDVTRFLLRMKEELTDGEGVVELDFDVTEMSGVVSPLAFATAEESSGELLRRLKGFAGEPDVVENEKLDLTRFEDILVKTASVTVPCESLDQVRRKSELIKNFLEANGFERVQEEATEDTYVSYNGTLARANFVQSPGVPMMLRLAVHIPKSVTEANLIRGHYGLSEVEFVKPEVRRAVAKVWDDMDAAEREDALHRKAGLKPDHAKNWAKHSFDQILDMHPFLAQRLSKELGGVRV